MMKTNMMVISNLYYASWLNITIRSTICFSINSDYGALPRYSIPEWDEWRRRRSRWWARRSGTWNSDMIRMNYRNPHSPSISSLPALYTSIRSKSIAKPLLMSYYRDLKSHGSVKRSVKRQLNIGIPESLIHGNLIREKKTRRKFF